MIRAKLYLVFALVLSGGITLGQATEPAGRETGDAMPSDSSVRSIHDFRPVHFSYGFNLWDDPENYFHEELFESSDADPSVFSNQFDLLFTLPLLSKNRKHRFLAGLGYEWIRKEQNDFMEIEYIESAGWLDFTPKLYGDLLEMNHKINIYSLIFGYQLRSFPRRNRIGTGISVLMPIRFYSIHETENIEMQGNYSVITTQNGDYLYYESDYFSRDKRIPQLAIKPGIRFDLYVGKYFSLILPEISYEFTIYSQKIEGVQYNSTVDDDQLIIPDRDHKLNTLVVTFGMGVHF